MRAVTAAAAFCCLAAMPAITHAQENNEPRLRDAVRQAVTEMRAAQDQAAQAQADLAKAQADKQALQTQLDAASAKLAENEGKPKAPAADVAALQNQLRTGQAQNAALQQLNAKLQANYQSAADQARAKADEAQQSQAARKEAASTLQFCKATNAKLIDVSEQVLHLYENESFRALFLKSYEPVIGTWKVKLENLIQTYDDKIQDQEYVEKPSRRR